MQIATGQPPAERPQHTEGVIGDLWNFFQQCWDLMPGNRPIAADVAQFLLEKGESIANAIDLYDLLSLSK